ncbi:tRNA (adenosine(37)-N6)-dimethylallyltransferase MiaA [Faecalicoccus pleomorphus]|uniref:tRNA (adenosine(37)-N6)-dimethylallyltransferase MiaA n=1 Tax=Faecalicoccus pleomorphus TaxID=1323 RepID=UPI0039F55D4E
MDKVLVIVGPTGIGKTSLSIQLAKAFHGEIISGDSMQVYDQMDIGTAKITKEEMEGIPHYLVGIQAYDKPYNVKIFQEKARESIQKILQKQKLPILCGGTGLYLKAALYDYVFEEETFDEAYTKYLETLNNDQLYDLLKSKDPLSCEKIHPNNRKRVIRALQIVHEGPSKSQREALQEHKPMYDIYFLGLDMDRGLLYERINQRVETMFEQGLVQEATRLFQDSKTWNYTSFQGIGYKEFRPYFEGTETLDRVKENIKKHSRQYAKRQYTWFKHQMPVHWFDKEDPQIMTKIREWYDGK